MGGILNCLTFIFASVAYYIALPDYPHGRMVCVTIGIVSFLILCLLLWETHCEHKEFMKGVK